MSDERYARGLANRTEVLGAEYVQRSLAGGRRRGGVLQRLVTEFCWGDVWGRAELSRRDRSLATLSMLIALDRPREIEVHVRGALNNGVTEAEILELVAHSAVYCGVPAALEAQRSVEQALDAISPPVAQPAA